MDGRDTRRDRTRVGLRKRANARALTSRRLHGEASRGGGFTPVRARGDHDDHLPPPKILGPSDAYSRQSRLSTSMSPRSSRPCRTRGTERVSTSRARTREISTRARPAKVSPASKAHPARSRCAEARGHAAYRCVVPRRRVRETERITHHASSSWTNEQRINEYRIRQTARIRTVQPAPRGNVDAEVSPRNEDERVVSTRSSASLIALHARLERVSTTRAS